MPAPAEATVQETTPAPLPVSLPWKLPQLGAPGREPPPKREPQWPPPSVLPRATPSELPLLARSVPCGPAVGRIARESPGVPHSPLHKQNGKFLVSWLLQGRRLARNQLQI